MEINNTNENNNKNKKELRIIDVIALALMLAAFLLIVNFLASAYVSWITNSYNDKNKDYYVTAEVKNDNGTIDTYELKFYQERGIFVKRVYIETSEGKTMEIAKDNIVINITHKNNQK